MLYKVADNYDEEVRVMTEGLTKLIEPMLIVFLGVAVGFIVVSLFMPLIELITSLTVAAKKINRPSVGESGKRSGRLPHKGSGFKCVAQIDNRRFVVGAGTMGFLGEEWKCTLKEQDRLLHCRVIGCDRNHWGVSGHHGTVGYGCSGIVHAICG